MRSEVLSVIVPFCLRVADLIATARGWREFLVKLDEDSRFRYTTGMELRVKYYSYPQGVNDLSVYIEDLAPSNARSTLMLYTIVIHNFSARLNDDVVQYANELLTAFRHLKNTPYHDSSQAPELAADSLVSGFNQAYVDRHGLISDYSATLRRHMVDWIARPTSWNAPYTSIVNSSMTGKSRCHKQMAMYDPVIFFCLRPAGQSGYPRPSLNWVQQAIQNPFGIKGEYGRGKLSLEEQKKVEEQGVIGHLSFLNSSSGVCSISYSHRSGKLRQNDKRGKICGTYLRSPRRSLGKIGM
jgi:hypothetical protein